MQNNDSYVMLARSIERTLRSDLSQPQASPELAWQIDRALLEEAHTGERAVAQLRAAVAGAASLAALWSAYAAPAFDAAPTPRALAALYVAWLAGAGALLAALRRGWYRRWLRFATPAADAAVIAAGFLLSQRDGGAGAAAALGALCGFLAASGTLRLSKSSARLSTALAVVVFVLGAAAARLPWAASLAASVALAAAGALGAGVGTLVRRVVTDQVGRVELSRLYDEARQAVDAREEVLKIVSHDLRNPLSTIAMSAELMLEMPMTEEQRTKQLAVIRRAGERMNRLVQDLLEVAKLEAGRLAVSLRPLDVPALLAEAEETLRPLAEEKQIALELRAASWLPDCTADPGRTLQVLGNLVGNAVKFTPRGGRITVLAECAGPEVRFSVADTGPGIPPEHLPHVFGRFWQADRGDRRGIGLGLAISKGIVEAHGGRIWAESRCGAGTTFFFTLGAGARAGTPATA